jgi:hypothetical protein
MIIELYKYGTGIYVVFIAIKDTVKRHQKICKQNNCLICSVIPALFRNFLEQYCKIFMKNDCNVW